MVMSREEVLDGVKEVLGDALGYEEHEFTESSSLIYDMRAESIDFLDIVFRLEKEFGFKVPRGELFPSGEKIEAAEGYAILPHKRGVGDPGRLNVNGLRFLREEYPHVPSDGLGEEVEMVDVYRGITVKSVVDYVFARREDIGSSEDIK